MVATRIAASQAAAQTPRRVQARSLTAAKLPKAAQGCSHRNCACHAIPRIQAAAVADADSTVELMAEQEYFARRLSAVRKDFPKALAVDDFIARVEMALCTFGFTSDNTIAMTNLCRDEVTAVVKNKIDEVYGASFNTNGLGGVLTCGCTGMKAGFSHSPLCAQNKERYVFFSMPHIAVDSIGEVGTISRPGRPGKSAACGALIASLAQIRATGVVESCRKPGVHDPLDPEFSILKQRLARRIQADGSDINTMNLVDMTKTAERVITTDLEGLIEQAVDQTKADYAVVAGIQVHNWSTRYDDDVPNLEFVEPTAVYVVKDGNRIDIDLSVVPGLTPRQLRLVATQPASASASNKAGSYVGDSTVLEVEYVKNELAPSNRTRNYLKKISS